VLHQLDASRVLVLTPAGVQLWARSAVEPALAEEGAERLGQIGTALPEPSKPRLRFCLLRQEAA